MPLTEEQIQAYLALDFPVCPYCGGEADGAWKLADVEGSKARKSLSCMVCLATWNEVYKLTTIEEVEPPQPAED